MMSVQGVTRPSSHGERGEDGVFDAVSFLSVYLVLLLAIPSYLTVTALGSLGQLHVLWGLAGLMWWGFVRLQNSVPMHPRTNPVKVVSFVFFSMVGVSYAIAQLQGLPSEDASWADSALLRTMSWAGVVLIALDGIHDRSRLMDLLRRIAWVGALVAGLGIVQFATGDAVVDGISLPGFQAGPEFASVFDRSGFTRAAGTAAHPLEYGSVLVVTLPIALCVALDAVKSHRVTRWIPSVVIAVAILLSMSRSVFISTAIALLMIAPTVSRAVIIRALGAGGAMLVAVSVAAPGMFGTLVDLFGDLGSDSGTTSRTDSASFAVDIALRNPVFGRGFGTFMPTELILDNQWVMLLIDTGIVGVSAFAAVALTCLWSGWSMYRHGVESRDRGLGPALSAGLTAGFINMAFYDGLAFPQAAGVQFLMIGVMGAALSISRTTPTRL